MALSRSDGTGWDRLKVGARPTAVLLDKDGRRAFVANTFSDSISVVDLQGRKALAEISLGPRPEPSPADRGEQLFFDARLSHDRWLSCHSCHTDGHTNGLLADTLGDGTYGTPKRVLSLRGALDTPPWAWNGSMPDLESQIRKSILTTQRADRAEDEDVRALAAYIRTLPPPPSLARTSAHGDDDAVHRGHAVFEHQGCGGCHAPPTYTSPRTYNVDLRDEAGLAKFNPPSLRGVSQGGPYFHDGRAGSLKEVFTAYRHQLRRDLTRQELNDLLAFLRTL